MRETHQSDSSHFLRQAAATTSAASVRGRICLPCAQFVWRILSLFNGHVKDMFFFIIDRLTKLKVRIILSELKY